MIVATENSDKFGRVEQCRHEGDVVTGIHAISDSLRRYWIITVDSRFFVRIDARVLECSHGVNRDVNEDQGGELSVPGVSENLVCISEPLSDLIYQ